MKIREITSKSILTKSQIYNHVVNPYVGCQHGCFYCYAKFMKRFTGHTEPWGEFVDIKINAPELLAKEINKKKRGAIWMSGVCDPYQPLEEKYKLTRRCAEIIVEQDWPLVIQTRSPLVARDIDVLKRGKNVEAGLSITTADDKIRTIFEPHAPPIPERLNALESLHKGGIRTYVMIAPILPGAEDLPKLLAGKADYILVDRMNYSSANWIYKKHGWQEKNTDEYFEETGEKIEEECNKAGIECRRVY